MKYVLNSKSLKDFKSIYSYADCISIEYSNSFEAIRIYNNLIKPINIIKLKPAQAEKLIEYLFQTGKKDYFVIPRSYSYLIIVTKDNPDPICALSNLYIQDLKNTIQELDTIISSLKEIADNDLKNVVRVIRCLSNGGSSYFNDDDYIDKKGKNKFAYDKIGNILNNTFLYEKWKHYFGWMDNLYRQLRFSHCNKNEIKEVYKIEDFNTACNEIELDLQYLTDLINNIHIKGDGI